MDLRDRRVVVMGLGRFGGGVGVTRFLCKHGARVLVTDMASREDLADSLDKLSDLDVEYRLGSHMLEDFATADVVVVNPAVKPRGNHYLAAARQHGARITSEMRLLVQHLPDRRHVIGITGTAGKSTVTSMVGHILERLGPVLSTQQQEADQLPLGNTRGDYRVYVGGNIGGSLLEQVDRIKPEDWVVLELSSFMLDGLAVDHWSPGIAVITNLAPNHLDWHGTYEDYLDAKQHILAHQHPGDAAILGPGVRPIVVTHKQAVHLPEPAPDRPVPLLVPGEHNQWNAHLAAAAVCAALPVELSVALNALADFAGLPHRLCLIAEHDGVRFYNDSKSTTPEAAMLAISAFEPRTVHAILGGYDKGSDLRPLAALARQQCHALYCVGATGPAIARAASEAEGRARVVESERLDDAVRQAVADARPGDVVLLSPGCASWDQFANYEARGDAFTAAVHQHATPSEDR